MIVPKATCRLRDLLIQASDWLVSLGLVPSCLAEKRAEACPFVCVLLVLHRILEITVTFCTMPGIFCRTRVLLLTMFILW